MKPTIRTITGFISVKDFSKFDELLKQILSVRTNIQKAGYEVQTVRITTDIIEHGDVSFIDKLQNESSVGIYHLGSVDDPKILTEKKESELVELLLSYSKSFLAINSNNAQNSRQLALSAARMCKQIAKKDPFQCRRFALFAGVNNSTPFYPASKVFNNSMKFSIGLQCANLAVEEAEKSNKNVELFEKSLRQRMETEFAQLDKIIPSDVKNSFIGFDTSLAPFPRDEESIANAIEIISGKPFGSSGTLSICRVLTRVMQENNIQKTGLCGLMLPVVEDNILAKRGIEGNYSLDELLLYSAVCATGLDAVPVSGKTSIEDMAARYMDLITLANKLQKPLSARFFIELDKDPGETVKYDWKFACESPVFKI